MGPVSGEDDFSSVEGAACESGNVPEDIIAEYGEINNLAKASPSWFCGVKVQVKILLW